MAGFRKDKTTSYNAALMTAGTVVEALIAAGVVKTVAAAGKALTEIVEAGFAGAAEIVDADNALFESVEQADVKAPAKRSSSKPAGRKPAARKSSNSGGGSAAEQGGDLTLNSGKFKDLTIREVAELSEEEAADYGHRDGEAGITYVEWLASDRNRNSFTRDAAAAYLEEAA